MRTDTITCPGCQRRLVLPAGVEADFLSCPKCLARIPNPQKASIPAALGIQAAPEHAPPAPHFCPSCARTVDPAWHYCPHCNQPLGEGWALPPATVDREVRQDARRAIGCLGLLAFLGGGGTILVLANVLAVAGPDSGNVLATALFGFLALAAVVTIVLFARGTTPSVGKVVVGTLATLGGLILVWVALLIFLFIVCLVSPSRIVG